MDPSTRRRERRVRPFSLSLLPLNKSSPFEWHCCFSQKMIFSEHHFRRQDIQTTHLSKNDIPIEVEGCHFSCDCPIRKSREGRFRDEEGATASSQGAGPQLRQSTSSQMNSAFAVLHHIYGTAVHRPVGEYLHIVHFLRWINKRLPHRKMLERQPWFEESDSPVPGWELYGN